MSIGKKIIIACLIVVIAGALGLCGYELYDQFLKKDPLPPFVQGMMDEGFVYPEDLHIATMEGKLWKPDLSGWARYLMDRGKGLVALRTGFLYPIPLNPNYEIKNVDFAAWKAKNPEVIGYLEFENLSVISYPVLYREGTDYYLKHNINGADDIYGELYVEGKIKGGHSRTNTIIYGHNMRNGTMFGSLRKYKEASFFPGNEFFWYYTPTGKYRYQIFSVYETLYTSDTFTWFAEPGPDYTAYLQKMKSQTKYETGVTPSEKDEIITLCTCTSAGGNYRLILQGRLIYKEEKTPAPAPASPAPSAVPQTGSQPAQTPVPATPTT